MSSRTGELQQPRKNDSAMQGEAIAELEQRRTEIDFPIKPLIQFKRQVGHTCRWLKRGGVLLFIIPQGQLARCGRSLDSY